MLGVHIFAFAGFGLLYGQAPCWMQKLVMGLLAVGMGVVALSYAALLNSFVWEHHMLYRVGVALEHLAVLLYAFRLLVQGAPIWKASSAPSRSSPG